MPKGGWRDVDGRTASERHAHDRAVATTRFMDRLRQRPTSLIKPGLSALFILIIVLAVALRYL